MILYRTKLFGLLSDRVFKAIQESGKITGKKLDRLEARQLMREVDKKSETSLRTIENLWKEGEIVRGRLDKKIDSLRSQKSKLDKGADTAADELLDYIQKHDYKIDKTDPEFIKLNNKAKELSDKLSNNKEYKELESQLSDLEKKRYDPSNRFSYRMDLQSKRDSERLKRYYDYQRQKSREKEYFNKPSTSEINESWRNYIDGLNEVERPNAFIDSLNDRIDDYNKKYYKKNWRKTKNSEKIYKDVENEYYNQTGKRFIKDGEDYYTPTNGAEVHLSSNNPATALHEARHAERDRIGIGLDRKGEDFYYPKGVQDYLEYIRKEEGDANKMAFRKMFLNKHSGGRDWRTTNNERLRAMGSYYNALGENINKTGWMDLEYNVPKELMEKIRENAKKKGIDLNRSQKINYKPATEDEAINIKKYVYRKGRSNYQ